MIARISLPATNVDLLRLYDENPGWQFEREADGVVVMTPPAGSASSVRNAALAALVKEWDEKYGHGVVFDSSAGFQMPDSSVLSPDASWMSRARWNALTPDEREDFAPACPDICVELVSKSDRPQVLRDKLLRLRGYGASYVILIDPYRGDVWTDGECPPGFPTDFSAVINAA
jgi:Uma2 family endonuclease